MTHPSRHRTGSPRTAEYEIRVQGHLNGAWIDRFEGWTLTRTANGETRLTGAAVDQAALHGLLKRVRDLGLPLLSVARTPVGEADGDQEEHDDRDHV